MAVFGDMSPCSHVGVSDVRTASHTRAMNDSPDYGGSTHVWNVGLLLRDYTAPYSRTLLTSFLSQWESKISRQEIYYTVHYLNYVGGNKEKKRKECCVQWHHFLLSK
jgi:hypothetical protein